MANQSTTPLANQPVNSNPFALKPTLPANPQAVSSSFAPPASTTPNTGSIWSGLGHFFSNLAGGPGNGAVNQTTPGGTQVPSMGSIGIGNMAQPYYQGGGADVDPNAGKTSPNTPAPQANPSTAQMQSQLSSAKNTLLGMQQSAPQTSGKAPAGMEYGPNGELQFMSNVSQVPPITPALDTQNPQNSQPSQSSPQNNIGSQANALIQSLQGAGQITPDEMNLRNQIGAQNQSLGLGLAQIASNPEGMQLQTGQSNVLQQQGLAKGNYLTNQLANLVAQRQASIAGPQAAGQLATAEQGIQQQTTPVGIGTGLYSPFSNKVVAQNASYMGGDGSGTSGIINGLVQQLQNGAAWSDVVSQLPSSALAPMLSQAAQQAIPGFNPTTSNQNAGAMNTALQGNATQGLGLQRSAASANSALDTLSSFYSQLPGATTGGIPATNSISTWLGQQFGNTASSQYETALQDARAQLEGVLTATGATTPTGAEATAKAYLPDGMTPGQFQSKLTAARQLVQQKVSAFTQTGNVPQYGQNKSNSNASTNLYSW